MARFNKDDEMKFEITQHFGVLMERKNGWKKELNKVKWGDNDPKWDIREWNEEHDKMSRGITLTEEEAGKLSQILKQFFC